MWQFLRFSSSQSNSKELSNRDQNITVQVSQSLRHSVQLNGDTIIVWFDVWHSSGTYHCDKRPHWYFTADRSSGALCRPACCTTHTPTKRAVTNNAFARNTYSFAKTKWAAPVAFNVSNQERRDHFFFSSATTTRSAKFRQSWYLISRRNKRND